MSVVTGGSEAAGGPGGGNGTRVFFQSPRGGASGSPGSSREDSAAPVPAAAGQVQQQQQRRHQQGKVTVKYDRKELRKRLVLEEWIVEQLGQLYGCEVPGRRAGRVGAPCALSRAGIVGRQLPSAHRQLSGTARSPRGALAWGAACGWDAASWVQLPGAGELGVFVAEMGGYWVQQCALLSAELWAFLGSSCTCPREAGR